MSGKGRVNVPILVAGLAIVSVLVALLWVSFGRNPRAVPSVLEAKPAPSFALKDLDGNTWTLADLEGKPVVINFWSTWCQPCKIEYPVLQQAQQAYPDVQFLGVIYSDDAAKSGAFLKRQAVPPTYPNLVDPGGRVAVDYGVAGVPETYFVAPDGTVAYKHSGPLSQQQIAAVLDPLRGRE